MLRRLFVPRPTSLPASVALLLLRVVAGVAFALHGWGKIQKPFSWAGDSFPGFLQFLAALSEFGGGIAWAIGAVMPLASVGIACTMAVAFWQHAVVRGDPLVGGYELALVYFCVAFLFFVVGPGRFSADRMVFGKRGPPPAQM